MRTITTKDTIERLRDCFARFGLPDTIVSDNGTQLTSYEFGAFCLKNGVKHLTTAPYHPQSNGAAENSVKSFKKGLNKALTDPKNKNASLQTLANCYLYYYRSSIHATTQETPYRRMFGREMKTQFSKMQPYKLIKLCDEIDKESKKTSHKTNREFKVNEAVFCENFGNNQTKWEEAIMTQVLGNKMYICKTKEGEWRRHANQMIKKG